MGVGIKVSREGYNVGDLHTSYYGNTYARPNELIFSSDWALFKTINTGTVTISVASTSGSSSNTEETIAHGLSYAPAVMIYYTFDGTDWYTNGSTVTNRFTTTEERFVQCSADTTNLYISIYSANSAAYSVTVRWFVLGEQNE